MIDSHSLTQVFVITTEPPQPILSVGSSLSPRAARSCWVVCKLLSMLRLHWIE